MGIRRPPAVGGTAVLLLVLGLGACGGPAGPAPAAPAATSRTADVGRPLSPTTLSYVNRPLSRYEVERADPAAARPAVSPQKAVEAANRQVVGARAPAQMSLVRYTNKVASTVQPGTGKRHLAVTDRLAWAMVYDGFQATVSVPPAFDVKKGKVVAVPPAVPTSAPTSLVMFVDAATGDYLESVPMVP
jgi:hypothetical protein